jgi:cytochrome P450
VRERVVVARRRGSRVLAAQGATDGLRLRESMTDPGPALADVARLTEREFYVGDPHAAYARLRSEAPVWWCDAGNFWALTRYDDVTAVAANPAVFSSAYGSFLPDAKYPDKIAGRSIGGTRLSFGSDPPEHTRSRRLVSSVFTPAAIRGVEPFVRRIVVDAVDTIEAGEIVDVVDDLSVATSINVIAGLLGVPRRDWADFKRWSDALSGHLDAAPGSDEEAHAHAQVVEMEAYLLDQLARRRRRPRDDWLSMIAAIALDGAPSTPEFQLGLARALLVAGNETTRNTISAGVVALATHPDQVRRLHDDLALSGAATDEILRWTSVIHAFIRRATGDTEIRGQRIAAGQFVALFFPAANRDEAVWTNADRFDITRTGAPPHTAYSWGPHRCLGAHLANLEIRVAFEELARRYANWTLAGPVRRLPSTIVDVHESVPVRFDP